MTSKEAWEVLTSLATDGACPRLDPVKCHDLTRLGLIEGEVANRMRDGEENFPIIANITRKGEKLIRDEDAFHAWWNRMTTFDEPMYTEECVRYALSRLVSLALKPIEDLTFLQMGTVVDATLGQRTYHYAPDYRNKESGL